MDRIIALLAALVHRPWTVRFTLRRAFACGLLLGLAVMVRPISLAVVPVIAVCWLHARKDWGVAARWTGALLVGIAVCVVPWTVRNQVRLHAFVPISTNMGDNLCIGHAEGADGSFNPPKACDTPQYRFLDGLPAELGSDKTLWLEANAAELNGVSFDKGCYVGQENTARMNWRQKVGRRLVVVRHDADPHGEANMWYPTLGLGVERRRVEAIAGDPAVILPDWLRAAL